MIQKIKSGKKCLRCGKPAYSFRIGWKSPEGITEWHPPKHYNHCEECRTKMYKEIERKKKLRRQEATG